MQIIILLKITEPIVEMMQIYLNIFLKMKKSLIIHVIQALKIVKNVIVKIHVQNAIIIII